MTGKAPIEDVNDDATQMVVGEPKTWAAGVPGVTHSMGPALSDMGVGRTVKLMTQMNQRGGFDCMSCAWPDPDHRKTLEFCENGAKAVTWEATPVTIPTSFWAENSLTSLWEKSEYWLGMQGRLIEPLYKPKGKDNYEPISWENAFTIIGDRLKALDDPNEATFYTSGRTANETAFVYQLLARSFGTNNLPDCSNMCHESTGKAMDEAIGIGKNTIAYKDFEKADLIIIMGQNPGTNHPRMLTALEDARNAGATIVAINPLLEAGLIRYKNPQKVRGIIGHGVGLASQYLQIRAGGDGSPSVFSRPRPRTPARCSIMISSTSTARGSRSSRHMSQDSMIRRCSRQRASPRPKSTSLPHDTSKQTRSSSRGRWG